MGVQAALAGWVTLEVFSFLGTSGLLCEIRGGAQSEAFQGFPMGPRVL